MCYSRITMERHKKLFYKFYQNATKNELSQERLNILKRSKRRLEFFWQIIEKSLNLNLPIQKVLPYEKRATFYRIYQRIKKAFFGKKVNLEKLLLKSTKPNNFREFYKLEEKQSMCDTFYDENNLHNKTSTWIILKRTYSKLSIRTFIKYLNNDPRGSWKLPKLPKVKHPRREYDIELGNLQMDVKVLDNRENPLHTNIYLLNFIDEQSKFAYSEIIDRQTPEEILSVLKRSLKYFEQNGIKIQRIRTDNFMAFKKTNFVRTGLFNKYLESKNIIHQFTPLGEPQGNGVVERFNKTISDEFCKWIQKDKDINTIHDKLKIWITHYNHKRYHYYQTIKEKEFIKKFMIPKEMINLMLKQQN